MESNNAGGTPERFIIFTCPACDKKTGFAGTLAGQVCACPLCKANVLVPERSGEPSFVVGGIEQPAPKTSQSPQKASQIPQRSAIARQAPQRTAHQTASKKAVVPEAKDSNDPQRKPFMSLRVGIAAGVVLVGLIAVSIWAFTRPKSGPEKDIAKAALPVPEVKSPASSARTIDTFNSEAASKPVAQYPGLAATQAPEESAEKSNPNSGKSGKPSVAENWAEEFIKNGAPEATTPAEASKPAPAAITPQITPEDEREALLGKSTRKKKTGDDEEEAAAAGAQPKVDWKNVVRTPAEPTPPAEPAVQIRPSHPELVTKIVAEVDAAIKNKDEYAAARKIRELAITNAAEAITPLLNYARVNNKTIFDSVRSGLGSIDNENALKSMLSAFRNAMGKTGWTTRVLLLDAFGAKRETPQSLEAMRSAIEDGHPKVRLAAIRTLGKNNWSVKESVPLLVSALGVAERNQDKGTPHLEARRILVTLTGFDFARAIDWQNFLKKPGNDFVKNKGTAQNASLTDPSYYYDMPVTSQRLLFIIDISGSMSEMMTNQMDTTGMPEMPVLDFVYPEVQPEHNGHWEGREGERKMVYDKSAAWDKWYAGYMAAYSAWLRQHPKEARELEEYQRKYAEWSKKHLQQNMTRIDKVKAELIALIQKLPQTATFNIISFNNTVNPWQQTLTPAAPNVKADAIAYVQKLKPYGETSTDLVLEAAFEYNWQADTVYLLSDGEPSRDGTNPLPIQPILSRVQELNRYHRIIIHTLMVGNEGMNFMKELAAQNAGIFEDISNKTHAQLPLPGKN